jgi:hypothetical protein
MWELYSACILNFGGLFCLSAKWRTSLAKLREPGSPAWRGQVVLFSQNYKNVIFLAVRDIFVAQEE